MISDAIWITYRDGIKWMGDYTSDNLWGCMMRVGQMQLAQCLRIYRDSNGLDISDWEIFKSFDDDSKKSVYSSMHLLNGQTAIKWGLKVGNWITPHQIAHAISELHTKTPQAGFEGLKIVVQEKVVDFDRLS